MVISLLVAAALLFTPAESFSTVPTVKNTAFNSLPVRDCGNGNGSDNAIAPSERRRSLLTKTVSASFIGILPLLPERAFADVSDGTALPQGAAQFSRILRTKSDLNAIGKRVKERAAEIDEKEWDNISLFLRKLYNAGEDMKTFVISDPEKKKRAGEVVQLLQKVARAGDVPAQKGDAEAFLVIYDKASKLIDEFFDLISDVPDEI